MEPEKKSNGALVGLVVIVIILVIGGIYLWQSNKDALNDKSPDTGSVTINDSTELDSLEQESASTDIDVGASAIESIQ